MMSEKNIPATIQTGLAHHQAGRLDQAHAIYAAIPESSPSFAHALYLMGVIAQDQSEHEKAIALFDRAAHTNPNEPVIPFQRAVSLSHTGDIDLAMQSYQQALALNPNYVEAHCNLGNLLKQHGDKAGAIDSYERALKLAPQAAQIVYNLGVCHQDHFSTRTCDRLFPTCGQTRP